MFTKIKSILDYADNKGALTHLRECEQFRQQEGRTSSWRQLRVAAVWGEHCLRPVLVLGVIKVPWSSSFLHGPYSLVHKTGLYFTVTHVTGVGHTANTVGIPRRAEEVREGFLEKAGLREAWTINHFSGTHTWETLLRARMAYRALCPEIFPGFQSQGLQQGLGKKSGPSARTNPVHQCPVLKKGPDHRIQFRETGVYPTSRSYWGDQLFLHTEAEEEREYLGAGPRTPRGITAHFADLTVLLQAGPKDQLCLRIGALES